MCGASASIELNVRSENQGSLYASQAAESCLRFPTIASACADWVSARVMHETTLRLNLCMPMLCTEKMCSTHVFFIMLQLVCHFIMLIMGFKVKVEIPMETKYDPHPIQGIEMDWD